MLELFGIIYFIILIVLITIVVYPLFGVISDISGYIYDRFIKWYRGNNNE